MTEFFQALTDNIASVSICGVSLATIIGLIVGLVKILSSNKTAKKIAELEVKFHVRVKSLESELQNGLKEVVEVLDTIKAMLQNNKAPNEIIAYISTILSQSGNEEVSLEYERNLAGLIEKSQIDPIEIPEEIVETVTEKEEVVEKIVVKEQPSEQMQERVQGIEKPNVIDEEMIVNA